MIILALGVLITSLLHLVAAFPSLKASLKARTGERAIGLAVQPDGGAVLAGFEYASTPHVLVARAWG